jgi:hypothetical protein
MRRLIEATVLVIVAVSLSACGGGGTTTATPAASAPAAPPVPPTANAGSANTYNTLSPPQGPTGVAFPVGVNTPEQIKSRIDSHQPMIILYYDPSQVTSNDQTVAISAAMAKYRGLIDLLQYDVTGALPTGDNSQVTTRSEAITLETRELGVKFTPYVFVIDRAGIVVARYAGYVDSETLQLQILKATQ